jgi:hypothetical protein
MGCVESTPSGQQRHNGSAAAARIDEALHDREITQSGGGGSSRGSSTVSDEAAVPVELEDAPVVQPLSVPFYTLNSRRCGSDDHDAAGSASCDTSNVAYGDCNLTSLGGLSMDSVQGSLIPSTADQQRKVLFGLAIHRSRAPAVDAGVYARERTPDRSCIKTPTVLLASGFGPDDFNSSESGRSTRKNVSFSPSDASFTIIDTDRNTAGSIGDRDSSSGNSAPHDGAPAAYNVLRCMPHSRVVPARTRMASSTGVRRAQALRAPGAHDCHAQNVELNLAF